MDCLTNINILRLWSCKKAISQLLQVQVPAETQVVGKSMFCIYEKLLVLILYPHQTAGGYLTP